MYTMKLNSPFFPSAGLCSSVELSIDHKDAGFFLKPLFGGHQPWGPTVSESLFVVTHPKGTVRVRASYGPFAAEEVVSPTVLQQTLGNQSVLLNNVVVDDMDVSAHLVTRSITQERPVLQVLFHASHPHDAASKAGPASQSGASGGSRKNKNKDTGTVSGSVLADEAGGGGKDDDEENGPTPLAESWCLQTHVVKAEHELTSVCRLSHAHDVCVVKLELPVDWWDPLHIQSADVYYSVYRMDSSRECAGPPPRTGSSTKPGNTNDVSDDDAANTILPDKEEKPASDKEAAASAEGERIRSYIGTVTLTSGQLTYAEMKEDQHVLVYIPQKTFYPGSTFRVPVRLQAESDLTLFVVR